MEKNQSYVGYIFFSFITLLGIILFFNMKVSHDHSSLDIVAQVTNIQNNVQQKKLGSIFWDKLSQQQDVFNKSYIFSGESSEVSLLLSEGESITLGSNTIVHVEINQIALESGSVSGEFIKTALKVGDQKFINKTPSRIEVYTRDSTVELRALEENARIQINDEVVSIPQHKTYDLKHRRIVSQNKIELISPVELQKFDPVKVTTDVKFSWVGNLTAGTKLVVSRKSLTGEYSDVKFEVKENEYTLALACGDYRWTIDQNEIPPFHFSIPCEEGALVNLIEPFNRAAIISNVKQSVDVEFRWQGSMTQNIFLIKASNLKFIYHERGDKSFKYLFNQPGEYIVEITPFLHWPIWQKTVQFRYEILDEAMLRPKIKSPQAEIEL